MIRKILILLVFSAPLVAQDESKMRVEQPIKDRLAAVEEAPGEASAVRWHGSLDEAIRAARESGRPILHFQLLGRLDDEFC